MQADNNHSSDSDGNSATESSQNPPNAENTIPLASTSVPTGVNHTVQNSSHEVHIHCGSSSSRVKEENVEDSKGKQKDEGPEYISSGTQTDPVEPADPLFSPSCARPTIHRLTQCSGTTRAGLRCKLFVRVTNETCAVYCHYHKGREPSCSPDCHSQGHSGTNIRINITTSSTIQCSGINRKGTRCGLRVRPIDGATNVYCHFHIPQRIRVEEPFQTPSPSSTQWNQSETHYSAYPEIRVVTVQCSGRARTGQQCRRLLRANNNLSPTYCSQHAPQQLKYVNFKLNFFCHELTISIKWNKYLS